MSDKSNIMFQNYNFFIGVSLIYMNMHLYVNIYCNIIEEKFDFLNMETRFCIGSLPI